MPESLALKYRPVRFCDVAGQRPAMAVLYAMASRRRMHSALLLSGNRGSGKTTTARIVASAVNCTEEVGPPESWPCGTCPSCKSITAGSSLDVLEIDAASNGGVDEIRSLRKLTQFAPTGNCRVVILDEVHSASRDAFNALLKILEEPPPATMFILLTTEHAKILPTVASRCMHFGFRRLPPEVITERLAWICQQEQLVMEPELLREISDRADGAMRDAVVLLDQMARVGIRDAERFRLLMGESDFGPVLVHHMASGNPAQMFAGLDEILRECGDYQLVSQRVTAALCDLLVLLSGGHLSVQGAALERRIALARSLDTTRVAGALRVMWELRTRVTRADPRGALNLALVMGSERLCPPRPVVTGTAYENGNGAMTHEQLQALSAR
jgi:DNA polymerase-3 subunit gamma/tau